MNYDTGVLFFCVVGILVLIALVLECGYLWVNDKKILVESKLLYWCDSDSDLTDIFPFFLVMLGYFLATLYWPLLLGIVSFCSVAYFLRFVVRMKKVTNKMKEKLNMSDKE